MIKKSLSDANLVSKPLDKVTDTNFRIEKVQQTLQKINPNNNQDFKHSKYEQFKDFKA